MDGSIYHSKWIRPLENLSKNAYRVQMQDDSIRIIHADNLRFFKSDVNVVGVIFDDFQEFGEIAFYPPNNRNNEIEKQRLENSEK